MPDPVIQRDVSLKTMNTLGLPGTAQGFAHFSNLSDLLYLQRYAAQHELPLKVLGGGSNVLLSDPIRALVIHCTAQGIRPVVQTDDTVFVDVDAGVPWHQWVCRSIEFGHGLENLALIPGSVGAAPIQNIGAYGVEVGSFIDSVTGYQLSTRQLRTLSAAECRFGYRDSVFKGVLKDDFVILRVRFRLQARFDPVLVYAPLNQLNTHTLTPQSLIDEVISVRRSKLPDPAQVPNAGSYFQNPLVADEQAAALKAAYPEMPVYPQAKGTKLAAGWLIQQCGFKGASFGPVGMYEKQALVLTASEGASLQDVLALESRVQQSVLHTFGVSLEREPGLFA